MKISDEIRVRSDVCCGGECGEYFGLLADRIDREMVELPKDRDGVPICSGDTLYDCKDGHQYQVRALRLDDAWGIWTNYGLASASSVTHERPDSLERIADELDGMVESADTLDDNCARLAELAERIRKLAKEEDK